MQSLVHHSAKKLFKSVSHTTSTRSTKTQKHTNVSVYPQSVLKLVILAAYKSVSKSATSVAYESVNRLNAQSEQKKQMDQ